MRVFLGLMVLVWLPYGLYCFLAPGYLEAAAGVAAVSATGATELRAMYGGLQAGIGLLAAAALWRPAWAPSALRALAFLAGGLGLARLGGAALEGAWTGYTLLAVAFEIGVLAACVALLRRPAEPAS